VADILALMIFWLCINLRRLYYQSFSACNYLWSLV